VLPLDLDAARNGSCQATYPDPIGQNWNNACNWVQAGYGTLHVTYGDGRPAQDDSDNIAVNLGNWAELHGTVFQDNDGDGWALEGGTPVSPTSR